MGNEASGYKIHAVVDSGVKPVVWKLTSLGEDERIVGKELIRSMPPSVYIVGDNLYDTNPLHAAASEQGMQPVARRRYGSKRGLGHQRHEPERLRSKAMLEEHCTSFVDEMLRRRKLIGRCFAWLTNHAGGLIHLPPWVRRIHPFRLWARAKVAIVYIKAGRTKDSAA